MLCDDWQLNSFVKNDETEFLKLKEAQHGLKAKMSQTVAKS